MVPGFVAKAVPKLLMWSLRFEAKSHVVKPEHYESFRKALVEMEKLADEWIILVPEEVDDAK